MEGFCSYLYAIIELSHILRSKKSIKVPFEYENESKYLDRWNKWFRLGGSDKIIKNDEIESIIDSLEINLPSIGNERFEDKRFLPRIKTKFSGEIYEIGEAVINEAISFIIQNYLNKKHFNEEIILPDFPYKVVEKLYYFKTGRNIDPFNLVLICDRALQTDSPGEYLFKIIDLLIDKPEIGNNQEKLAEFLFKEIILDVNLSFYTCATEVDLLTLLHDWSFSHIAAKQTRIIL